MKAVLIIAMLLSIVALTTNASAMSDTSDLADILHQYGIPSSKVAPLVEDLEDQDEDNDDKALAHVMTNVVISSLLEDDDDDGAGSLLDAMMQGNENEAIAQFRFFKRIAKRIGKVFNKYRSTPFGQFVGNKIRSRLCVGK